MRGPLYILCRRGGWNRLDLAIVIASIIGLCVYFMNPTVLRALHVFRVERLLRVLRLGRMLEVFQTIKVLFTTFVVALPAFLNIGGLIFVIFFIFAYIGVLAFGDMQLGSGLNFHANYQTW